MYLAFIIYIVPTSKITNKYESKDASSNNLVG